MIVGINDNAMYCIKFVLSIKKSILIWYFRFIYA